MISYNIAVTSIFVVFGAAEVRAHEQWADGGQVPAWVKQQCCGSAEAHQLRPDQVHITPSGYKVDGYRELIPEKRLLPSPDGSWWVFYRNYSDGNQGPVRCFFGPPQGS